jgi:hypothetical protein
MAKRVLLSSGSIGIRMLALIASSLAWNSIK